MSTNAQGKLKPRSEITREEGELGFLIIPRAQGLPNRKSFLRYRKCFFELKYSYPLQNILKSWLVMSMLASLK